MLREGRGNALTGGPQEHEAASGAQRMSDWAALIRAADALLAALPQDVPGIETERSALIAALNSVDPATP
jgi:cysteine sulfinate desulfinase/cysteine desulfurase-like protein